MRTRMILPLLMCCVCFALPAGGGSENKDGIVDLKVMIVETSGVPKSEGTLADNPWTRLIQEKMLQKGIRVEFIPRNGSQMATSIMMATNMAPDLSFTHGRLLFSKFASDGGLHPLDEYIEQYGPNITKVLGDENLRYARMDGVQYAVPSLYDTTARYISFIRKDWLDALGMELPTNREELETVLRAFRDQNPGNVDPNKLVPWGYFSDESGTVYDTDFRLFDAMYSFMKHDPDENIRNMWPVRDGFKEFMAWLNKLYHEGLIEMEFATDSYDTKSKKILRGEVGFFYSAWSLPYGQTSSGILANLQSNIPGAEIVPLEVFQNEAGEYRKLGNLPVHRYLFSPVKSKVPGAAVVYMNWMLEDETAWWLHFGLEGEQHVMQDGMPAAIDPARFESTFGYIDDFIRIMGIYPFKNNEWQGFKNAGKLYDFKGYDDRARELALVSSFDPPVFDEEMPVMMKNGPGLIKICEKYYVKMIVEDDFEAAYAEFIATARSRGLDEIVEERKAYFERRK